MSALPSLGWRRVGLTVALAVGATIALFAPTAAADATTSVAATTTVNIRNGPGLTYRVTGQLERGQRIRVYGSVHTTWVRVRFAGGEAYMAGRYLSTSAKLTGPTRTSAAGTKITTARLNLRSAPDPARGVVGTVAEGTRLQLTGKMTKGFAETRTTGRASWVSLTYLAKMYAAAPRPAPAPTASRGQVAYAFARTQLGKPYRFGASGPDAYDCSGLTFTSWRQAGVTLPRTAATQFHFGQRVSKGNLRVGDLVFFYGPTPSHVALYAGDGKIIHAPRPGKVVQIVPLDYMPYAGAVRPG